MSNKVQTKLTIVGCKFGVLFILRGLGLGIPYISPAPVVDFVSNNSSCH